MVLQQEKQFPLNMEIPKNQDISCEMKLKRCLLLDEKSQFIIFRNEYKKIINIFVKLEKKYHSLDL